MEKRKGKKTLWKAAFRQHLRPFIGPFGEGRESFFSPALPPTKPGRMLFARNPTLLSATGTAQMEPHQEGTGTAMRGNHGWVLVLLLLWVCRIWPGQWAGRWHCQTPLWSPKPCLWEAGRGLSFCIWPRHRALEISLKRRKPERSLEPCPGSSPTHSPSSAQTCGTGQQQPSLQCLSLQLSPGFSHHHGALRGGTTKGRYFLFFVPKHVPTTQFLVLSTASAFCPFLASTNTINFGLQLNDWDLFSWRTLVPWKILRFQQYFLAVESILKESASFILLPSPLLKSLILLYWIKLAGEGVNPVWRFTVQATYRHTATTILVKLNLRSVLYS